MDIFFQIIYSIHILRITVNRISIQCNLDITTGLPLLVRKFKIHIQLFGLILLIWLIQDSRHCIESWSAISKKPILHTIWDLIATVEVCLSIIFHPWPLPSIREKWTKVQVFLEVFCDVICCSFHSLMPSIYSIEESY